MAPSAECRECNKKWKTEHEPSEPGELKNLVDKIVRHTNSQIVNLCRSQAFSTPSIDFHEKTPDTGFEDAEVVKAK